MVPTFCDGLHLAEVDRHGIARLTFTTEQRDAYSGVIERVVAARLVLPAAVMAEIAARMLAASSASVPATTKSPARPLN